MADFSALDHIIGQFAVLMRHQHKLDIDQNMDFYSYIHLLVRDARLGLDFEENLTPDRVHEFLQRAMHKYMDPVDPTANNIKLKSYFTGCRELKLDFVKKKHATIFGNRLQQLVNHVLQYSDMSTAAQIDSMLTKIQIFIIACYKLGSPKDAVLLKQVRQSINSVVTRGDIQKYVLKKQYHRLQYLQRLSATVCGIVIYNNAGPYGDKEHMRDIFTDVFMARDNTKNCLEVAIQRAMQFIAYVRKASEGFFVLNGKERKLSCALPIEKTRIVTAYFSLFSIHKRYLEELYEAYQHTDYLIGVEERKFKGAIEKINEVLKFRTAIQSELVFPHFVHLSEVWNMLDMYFYSLAEQNKIKEQMDIFVSEKLIKNFQAVLEDLMEKMKTKRMEDYSFEELIKSQKAQHGALNFGSLKDHMKQHCTVTMGLTNGLLVPSKLQKKISENTDVKFGFIDAQAFKYAETCLQLYYTALKSSILGSVDLILLFDLEKSVFNEHQNAATRKLAKNRSVECQYERQTVTELSPAHNLNVTWNKWHYYQETIRLANLRKCQTRSAQTMLTYGQRDAQNQT